MGAGADEVEAFSAGFAGIVAAGVTFFDFEAAGEVRPAHGGCRWAMSGVGRVRVINEDGDEDWARRKS